MGGRGLWPFGEGRVSCPDLEPESTSHPPGVRPQKSPCPIPVLEPRDRKGEAGGVWAQGLCGDPEAQGAGGELWAGGLEGKGERLLT